MAKIKTYADGELLTAALINRDLNLDVPAGVTTQLATASFSAPSGLTLADGGISVARQGLVIILSLDVTANAANYLTSFRDLFTLAAQYRPPLQRRFLVDTEGSREATVVIQPTGVVQLGLRAATHNAGMRVTGSGMWLATS